LLSRVCAQGRFAGQAPAAESAPSLTFLESAAKGGQAPPVPSCAVARCDSFWVGPAHRAPASALGSRPAILVRTSLPLARPFPASPPCHRHPVNASRPPDPAATVRASFPWLLSSTSPAPCLAKRATRNWPTHLRNSHATREYERFGADQLFSCQSPGGRV
jgi:hypothetical protein